MECQFQSCVESGAVQGVGLRPRLKRWADEFAIAGWVRNDGDQVRAHIQGESVNISAFLTALRNRLAAVEYEPQPAPWQDCHGFVIVPGVVQPVSSLWRVPWRIAGFVRSAAMSFMIHPIGAISMR
ncbi:MAG: acylphosphatase [Gammaproteobacteria bacterium]